MHCCSLYELAMKLTKATNAFAMFMAIGLCKRRAFCRAEPVLEMMLALLRAHSVSQVCGCGCEQMQEQVGLD
eukprot:3349935-Pleurochrysis_carterae.AAC.1